MIHPSSDNKIQAEHLARTAIVYLRQSSPGQVKHNLESQRLQYALAQRASSLGFHNVEIIDCDLGVSAAMGSRRPGFQQLLTAVAVGNVGIIFSRELSRLSRTDKDWCHLLEMCQLFNTLIADEDTIYDPCHADDQLVLGIKGTLSAAELHLICMRTQRGKEAKAKRGELFCTVAPGYVRDGKQLVKDPNRRVQEIIALVFSKFLELGSVRQTYRWFLENHIEVPANKSVNGKLRIAWKLPAQTFIPSVLHNPVYAGAYAYGRRPVEKVLRNGTIRKRQRGIQPLANTKVLIQDHHEAYISWDTFTRVQTMVEQNATNFNAADDTTLAARDGGGLLTGLLRCARCGHKLQVRYWGRHGTIPRYLCNGDYQSGGDYCIGFSGKHVDNLIGQAVCSVLSPQGIQASLMAIEQFDAKSSGHMQALQRQLQEADYEANRAFEQYDQVDPHHRLVAETLEQRWNEKLRKVSEITHAFNAAKDRQRTLTDTQRASLISLGENFNIAWNHPRCDMTLKKRLLRTLVKEVISDIDEPNQQVKLIVHWQGGDHTLHTVPRPRPAPEAYKTAAEDLELIKQMSVRYNDSEIAIVLSRHGRRTGKGHRWSKTSVATARRKLGIKSAPPRDPDLLNMRQAKEYSGVSDSTLLQLIEHNLLAANQIAPFAPYEIRKSDLDKEPVATIIKTVKATGKLVLGGYQLANQRSLFL